MPHQSTKTYGHDVGLSCAFRQWRANSHCNQLHGYALAVRIVFGAKCLDERGWVVDFGGLKALKLAIQDRFDHKTIVASDDPHLTWYREAERLGILSVTEMKRTGCESFAEEIYHLATFWIQSYGDMNRCHVVSVEVKEHGANSAIYLGA